MLRLRHSAAVQLCPSARLCATVTFLSNTVSEFGRLQFSSHAVLNTCWLSSLRTLPPQIYLNRINKKIKTSRARWKRSGTFQDTRRYDWDPHHGLEGGVKLSQEGRLPGQRQHPLLHHGALHVVILDHDVLLQNLDGVQLLRAFALSKHHLQGDGR